MHFTALKSGSLFCDIYGDSGKTVVDIGGQNVNGSLRDFFINKGMKYICVDIEKHSSVDIVIQPGQSLPFQDEEVDMVISTSCFEHDPMFWMTFKEMSRITKLNGYIYVNAPSNGIYHGYPGDNWRFYSDAGQALAFWSGVSLGNENIFPVKLVESFHVYPQRDIWMDYICVWKRVDSTQKETSIIMPETIINSIGPLEKSIQNNGLFTLKRITK
jgi:hypothetical protein